MGDKNANTDERMETEAVAQKSESEPGLPGTRADMAPAPAPAPGGTGDVPETNEGGRPSPSSAET